MTAGVERLHRVTWRRSTWAPSTYAKSRVFTREVDALRFLEKLQAGNRPDLGHLEVCRYEVRTITTSAWETGL